MTQCPSVIDPSRGNVVPSRGPRLLASASYLHKTQSASPSSTGSGRGVQSHLASVPLAELSTQSHSSQGQQMYRMFPVMSLLTQDLDTRCDNLIT